MPVAGPGGRFRVPILLADTAANLAANEQVRQAYLGEI